MMHMVSVDLERGKQCMKQIVLENGSVATRNECIGTVF